MLLVLKKVLNIVTLAIANVADNVLQGLSHLGIIDDIPKNLPNMEDVLEDKRRGLYTEKDSVVVAAKIGDLLSDPTYNRTEDISYGNCERDLRQLKGFSYKATGILFAFVRPDYSVVVTQGNHRTTMLWMVTEDPNVRIPINLNFHPENISVERMIEIESENHNADCAFRSTQDNDSKFKSAFFSKQAWALKIFNFLTPFWIGIAGTLQNARFTCHSYNYISKARKESGDDNVKTILSVFTNLYKDVENPNVEILGNFVRSAALFHHVFGKHIAEVNAKNGDVDSFAEMIQYYFRDMEIELQKARQAGYPIAVKQNITQSDICKGSKVYKGIELFVCRFISLYNDYVETRDWSISGRNSTAIPVIDGKEFANFTSKLDPFFRQTLAEVAKAPVIHNK
jgi:hypothetical protein